MTWQSGHRAARKDIKAAVLSNREIAPCHYVMEIASRWLARSSVPGQFVNIKVSAPGSTDPLLRIPLGVHRIKKDGISVLYKAVGQATSLLSRYKKGDNVSVLGPLGKGFDAGPAPLIKKLNAVMVSGGHGVAPLYALAEKITGRKGEVDFFMGARNVKSIVLVKELKKLGARVHITTDDGTCGEKGCVTGELEKYLENGGKKHRIKGTRGTRRRAIFACGPVPMVSAVAALAEKYAVRAEVTRDEYMACGIGACRGCAVETTEGIKLACKDGPVFDSRIVKWQGEEG